MFLLWAILISIVIALLRGGSFKNFTKLKIRGGYFVITAIIIQGFLFDSFITPMLLPIVISIFHVISYGLICIFIILNYRMKGILIAGCGAILNFLTISLNGGYMPVDLDKLSTLNKHAAEVLSTGINYNGSIAISDKTIFKIFSDIFVLPSWIPLANVFSIGDILIAAGCFMIFQEAMIKDRNYLSNNSPY